MRTFAEWLKAAGFEMDKLTPEQVEKLQASYDAEKSALEAANKPPKKPVDNPADPPADKTLNADDLTAADEKKRAEGILLACGDDYSDIMAKAIKDDWSVETTNIAVLAAYRENSPQAPARRQAETAGEDQKVIEAALCLRAGIEEEELLKDYGDKILNAAYADRGISLTEVMASCLRASGKTVRRTFSDADMVAAFSTVSVPGILGNVANKRLLRSFNLQPITATKLSSQGDLADFKQASRFRLNDIGDIEKVGPAGELKSGTQGEEKALNQLDTYGKIFMMTRQMVVNDDLGAFMKVPDAMGARAAQKIDLLFYERLLLNPTFTNGNVLFSTENENFISGAASALDVDALDAANRLFLNAKDQDGQFIAVLPKFLLVPSSLQFEANQLVRSITLSQGGTIDRNMGTANPVQSMGLEVVVSPHLENPNTSGFSTKAWYLFADPAIADTFEIGFLKGRRTPTLEQVAPPANQLGIGWRIFFDLGIREQEFRTMVKNKGEA